MTAAIIIAAVVLYLLLVGPTPKPIAPPGTGTRADHRAAYGKKGFRI